MDARESRSVARKGALEVISSSLLLEAGLWPALKQVSHDFVQPGDENLQVQKFHSLCGQPLPALHYPTSDAFFFFPSDIRPEPSKTVAAAAACDVMSCGTMEKRVWLHYLGKYSLSSFRQLLDHSVLTFPVSSTEPCAEEQPGRR